MSRPPKPVSVLKEEGKSHRTKEEMERREKGEAALLSGKKCFERDSVKSDPVAHREYQRLVKLMRAINKDDALYAPVYNRYCELFSEIEFYLGQIRSISAAMDRSRQLFDDLEEVTSDDINAFQKQTSQLLGQLNTANSAVMQKRKMMFDIEKECCMTVSAALRTIPKEAEKADAIDPLVAILASDED